MTLDEGGWRRPDARIVPPPSVLRDVVEFFWIDEWPDDSATAHSFRVVADDAPHVLWYLAGGEVLRTQRLAVAGARSWHRDANLSGRRVMAGARLTPGAIPLLFGAPAFALTLDRGRRTAAARARERGSGGGNARLRTALVADTRTRRRLSVHQLGWRVHDREAGAHQHLERQLYTAGELTRREFPGYVPFAEAAGLWARNSDFTKILPMLRQYWQPYLDRKSSLEDAMRHIAEQW